jgi:hypothetical protein
MPKLSNEHLKVTFMQPHAGKSFMRSLSLTAVAAAAVSATAVGLHPQVRLGDCHTAGGISVQHKDGTYWST